MAHYPNSKWRLEDSWNQHMFVCHKIFFGDVAMFQNACCNLIGSLEARSSDFAISGLRKNLKHDGFSIANIRVSMSDTSAIDITVKFAHLDKNEPQILRIQLSKSGFSMP